MKTISIPKGAIQVNQLHEELLTAFPAWRGRKVGDMFVDPLLSVRFNDTAITLGVPDATDESAIQTVVRNHAPVPPADPVGTERDRDPAPLSDHDRIVRIERILQVDKPRAR